jgi:hypothetical protein
LLVWLLWPAADSSGEANSGDVISGRAEVGRTGMKILCGPSLKFCQLPLQSAKFQKAACCFTEVPTHQFAAVPASCAIINIREYVLNYQFRGTKEFSYLAILQAARDQEHCLELHWVQKIC